jgi:hypothetical protein
MFDQNNKVERYLLEINFVEKQKEISKEKLLMYNNKVMQKELYK